ncbi:uncharacterized protein DEA37_0011996 [Paragonimus westermani]|uniref:Uncharacterized protein n=1 Tax=Paragonimus westermani TaxID=34504 RepID=A0A5J4NKR4_9TREM|nr:uncharacterized protein DEA37_0011996 [Paragonimus westermani]
MRLFPGMNSFKCELSAFLFISIHICLFTMLCSQSNSPKNVSRLKNAGLLRTSTIPIGLGEHGYVVRQDASDPDWLSLETWITLLPYLAFYLTFSCSLRIILPNKYGKFGQVMRIVFCLIFFLYYVGLALVVDLFLLIGLGLSLGFLIRRRQLFIWLVFCGILGYSNDLLHSSLFQNQSIQIANLTGRIRLLTWHSILFRAGRMICWYTFWSAVLCFIYPNALMWYAESWHVPENHPAVDSWRARGLAIHDGVLCFAGFVSAIHFYFLHLFFYGIPTVFADLEQYLTGGGYSLPKDFQAVSSGKRGSNVNTPTVSKSAQLCLVPAPPSCVYHIVLFSEMWRTFDRGLYGFILRHIYFPLRGAFNSDSNNSKFFRFVLGFTSPFLFVLLFHSINQGNCVWAAFNLFQVASERTVKRLQRHSEFGRMLGQRFSPRAFEWLSAFVRTVSWFLSVLAFVFFRFGFHIGLQFAQHVAFTYGAVLVFVDLFCAQFVIAKIKTIWNYPRFPVGFNP